jgi:hypothetical protein
MAEARESDPRRVMLKNIRLSFPTLRTKEASTKGGKEKFSTSFLLDPNTVEGKTAIATCEKAIAAAESEHYGPEKIGFIGRVVEDPKRLALLKGERCKNKEGEVYKGYEGMIALKTAADRRPLLLAKNRTEIDIEDIETDLYGGVYCDAEVAFYCISHEDKGGNGLFCSVEAIRSRETGESFGGGLRASASSFDDLEDDDGIDEPATSSSGGLLGGGLLG